MSPISQGKAEKVWSVAAKGPHIDTRGLGWVAFDNLKKFKDSIFQIDSNTGEKTTFGDVYTKSIRVALHMTAVGLTSEDIISICSENNLECILPLMAALYLGVRVAPLDPILSTRDASHMLKLINPKIVFCSKSGADLIARAMENTGVETDIVVFGTSFSGYLRPTALEAMFQPAIAKNVKDTALIYFTSGTTGLPKAVCMSHYAIQYQTSVTPDPFKVLSFVRLYWLSSIYLVTCVLHNGGCWIFGTFDNKKIFKLIHDYKIDGVFIDPTATYKLTQHPEYNVHDTSSLKLIYTVGGTVSTVQIKKLKELFPKVLIIPTYAMTESGTSITFNPQVDLQFLLAKPASCGKPSPGVKCKIVDMETEEELGPYQKGELRIKTLSGLNEYFKDPEATKELFDNEGYLRTDDLMYCDEDGCYYAVERMRDMMKYQTWQITSVELEQIVMEVHGVQDCAVIARPHPVDGDHPLAIVVLVPGATCTAAEILEHTANRVPDYKRLRGGIIFVDEIPVTPSGKYRRRDLRTMLREGKI